MDYGYKKTVINKIPTFVNKKLNSVITKDIEDDCLVETTKNIKFYDAEDFISFIVDAKLIEEANFYKQNVSEIFEKHPKFENVYILKDIKKYKNSEWFMSLEEAKQITKARFNHITSLFHQNKNNVFSVAKAYFLFEKQKNNRQLMKIYFELESKNNKNSYILNTIWDCTPDKVRFSEHTNSAISRNTLLKYYI